jgi:predicted ATPase
MPRILQKLTIRGFRSIRHAETNLGAVNILLGPNSSGKSNFLSFFDLLCAIGRRRLRQYTAENGGADALFYLGTGQTPELTGEILASGYSYRFGLCADRENRVVFSEERFVAGRETLTSGKGHGESQISCLEDLFGSWIVYHFHDTGIHSRTVPVQETAYLLPDGGNLPVFLFRLKKSEPFRYQEIEDIIRFIYPEFGGFSFQEEDTVHMRWKTAGSGSYTFPLSALSDGTLRFTALAALLLQPDPPELLILDEPELGLHPKAVLLLTELIRNAAQRSQILISTQSVQLVSGFSVEDIIIVQSDGSGTCFVRPDPESLAGWLEDYSPGELWQKNLMGGNP